MKERDREEGREREKDVGETYFEGQNCCKIHILHHQKNISVFLQRCFLLGHLGFLVRHRGVLSHSSSVHFIALIKFIIVLVCTSGNTAEAIFDWKLLKLYLTRRT